MGERSAIEWTDASWNAVSGCSHVSEGCRNCYAEAISLRFGMTPKAWTAGNERVNVRVHPERLGLPERWKRPRRVFVNSMSDWAHPAIPVDFVYEMFDVMARVDRHTYQLLTKRPTTARTLIDGWLKRRGLAVLPAHLWVGVSVEQDRWCSRVDELRRIPARVRFVSAEPLLEALPSLRLVCPGCDGSAIARTLWRGDYDNGVSYGPCGRCCAGGRIHWLITGGESGAGDPARKMVMRCPFCAGRMPLREMCDGCGALGWVQKDWALAAVRGLRDRCVAAGTAFFHKQWGGPVAKSAGRVLDGLVWSEYPIVGA